MAMLQQIAPTKFHSQAYKHDAETTTLEDMVDPHLGIAITIGITTVTIKIGTGSADLDLAPIIPDVGVTVTVTRRSHSRPSHHSTLCHRSSSTYLTNETLHTADPHHTEVSPEITGDPGHTHPTNTITRHQQDHLPVLIKHTGKPRTGNTSKSPLMTHPQNTIALMNRTVTQRMI